MILDHVSIPKKSIFLLLLKRSIAMRVMKLVMILTILPVC